MSGLEVAGTFAGALVALVGLITLIYNERKKRNDTKRKFADEAKKELEEGLKTMDVGRIIDAFDRINRMLK